MAEFQPKIGDVVTLKSGGPQMTISCLTEGENGVLTIECEWFANDFSAVYNHLFFLDQLSKVTLTTEISRVW